MKTSKHVCPYLLRDWLIIYHREKMFSTKAVKKIKDMCHVRYIYFVRLAVFEIIKPKRTNVSKLIHNVYVSLIYIISDVLNHRLRRVRIQMNEIKIFVRRKFCAWDLHWAILHYCDPNKRTIPNKTRTGTT